MRAVTSPWTAASLWTTPSHLSRATDRLPTRSRRHTLPADSRSPDDASIKAKMIFASSKDALRRRLEGIHIEIQATDYSEISKDASGLRRFCTS